MKRSSLLVVAVVFIFLGVALAWLGKNRPVEKLIPPPGAADAQSTASAPDAGQSQNETRTQLQELYHAVGTEAVRTQVAADPHGTPAGMTDFANGIALLIRPALQSSEAAESLAANLEPCVLDAKLDIVESARALCLVNIQRLSNTFPGNSHLQSHLEKVTSQAPERVRDIAKAVSYYGTH